jgi:hypothetical protein
MKFKSFLAFGIFMCASSAFAVTECKEKITGYFIGTTHINEPISHLWVNFEGGGSASIGSQSAAFNGMLSTVLASIAADKFVTVRYVADNVVCKAHHSDWVGMWLWK